MENYTRTCRFILSCNYSSKIIDPIQSRCVVFKFKPLNENEIYDIINTISKNESLSIDESAKTALFNVSKGDVRKVENLLQSAAAITNNITDKTIYSISSQALPDEVKDILNDAVNNNFLSAKKKLLDVMYNQGLSGLDLIKQIQPSIWSLDVENLKKLEMIKLCGDIEFRMVEGSDEFIQLESLIAGIAYIKNK